MKFKEFLDWCNQRAFDGCWGRMEAIRCIEIIDEVRAKPFWRREKEWQRLNAEYSIEKDLVIPINKMIEEARRDSDG
jgi:hypothetical protein